MVSYGLKLAYEVTRLEQTEESQKFAIFIITGVMRDMKMFDVMYVHDKWMG